jgi:hypothetical protein
MEVLLWIYVFGDVTLQLLGKLFLTFLRAASPSRVSSPRPLTLEDAGITTSDFFLSMQHLCLLTSMK